MEPARIELSEAIHSVVFNKPICPIYQNVNGKAVIDPEEIKQNLISQLTSPVRWTQIMQNMINDGADTFIEVGPGTVLQGFFKKVKPDAIVSSSVLSA